MSLSLAPLKNLWLQTKHDYWTRQLRRAIRESNIKLLRDVLEHNPSLDGWVAASPTLFTRPKIPSIRSSANGALAMAFQWRASVEIFEALLQHGASQDHFDSTPEGLRAQCEELDKITRRPPGYYIYAPWLAENGPDISRVCQAFAQGKELQAQTALAPARPRRRL